MTIDAISTERQVKDGQIAASGPTEGVRGAHLCRPRAAQQRVPLVCPKCKAAVLIRCEPGLLRASPGSLPERAVVGCCGPPKLRTLAPFYLTGEERLSAPEVRVPAF